MFERILVPLDGSDVAEGVLPYATSIAKQFGSSIVLLRAVTPIEQITLQQSAGAMGIPEGSPEIAQEVVDAELSDATAYMASMKDKLSKDGLTVETEIVERLAAPGILDYVKTHPVSLLAMSTHGRGGLGRLLFGSVTDEVMRNQPNFPMLLIRPQ